jgi:spore maturation protein CgeE
MMLYDYDWIFTKRGEIKMKLSILQEILACEIAYDKVFSKVKQVGQVECYTDPSLLDMYDHNFTRLPNGINDVEKIDLIKQEIATAKKDGKVFCNIKAFEPFSENVIQALELTPEITRMGFYLFDITKVATLKNNTSGEVIQVSDERMIGELLKMEVAGIEDSQIIEFFGRKVRRRGEVYLQDGAVDSFLFMDQNTPVGRCDLFLSGKVAKIEDLSVLSQSRGKGYGTGILKQLMEEAIERGAEQIYLIADEDETAKEMYLKLGFQKISESMDLFFNLE